MKVPVYGLNGEVKGEISLAKAFSESIREDLITRAVVSEQSKKRQPYGADPLAGKRTSAHYHGRRDRRYTMMNREMARMARIHGSGFLHMTARFVPQAVKGRKAHPPKAEKIFEKDINKKEWLKALRSAIAATANKEVVNARGHKINDISVPVVVDDSIEKLKKTKDVLKLLEKLKLLNEIERAKNKKVREGKGTRRGRKYKKKKGILIVVKKDEGIVKAGENLPGIDVVEVDKLSVDLLAPGAKPGRLTIWSRGAIEELDKLVGV
ncbi:MAG: 50S ribosomal protein L4 [Candidatus Aenigmatarchaeota archaeon]|nr:MAG: 50S ribosomal protein L4 [Candidatus Aenigmarchaeota archaeon]